MKKSVFVLSLAAVAALGSGIYSCTSSAGSKGVGIETANFDSSFAPVSDFYNFSNGGWITANPIPDDQVRWGTFSILRDNNKMHLHELAEAASKKANAPKGSPDHLVGDFWKSAMDTVAIEG